MLVWVYENRTTSYYISGGEAQRIKLAKELSKRPTGRTLYILDEPTTGLHSHDIKKLLEILQAFANTGNTVVVIEHNLDVIKTADHIIDMGPEGGINGGRIIAEGTPEKVSTIKESYTGKFIREIIGKWFNEKNCLKIKNLCYNGIMTSILQSLVKNSSPIIRNCCTSIFRFTFFW